MLTGFVAFGSTTAYLNWRTNRDVDQVDLLYRGFFVDGLIDYAAPKALISLSALDERFLR
jgi:hypothetical protein